MRNLLVIQQRRVFIDLLEDETVQHFCIDADSGDAFVITNTAAVLRLAADTAQISWRLSLNSCVDIDAAIEAEGHVVTSVSAVLELEALCICTAEGALLLLRTGSQEVEQVGHFQGGIAAAAWSPDGAVLLILTALGSLLLMNQEWDVLDEVMLYGAELPIGLSPSQSAISWRGDGKFVATSVSPSSRPCLDLSKDSTEPSAAVQLADVELSLTADLRIWERDSFQLHAIGEAAEGLSPVLAWQPNGRHLYAAQRIRDVARVLLFEANGLQHGGFDIPLPGCIMSMVWNADSELLALLVCSDGQQLLQVWHRSNWHWYLKREEQYPLHLGTMLVCWDEASPGRLHLCTSIGIYKQIDLARQPIVSERGTAAVTDGGRLLLTPLRHTVVPPPMCAVTARAAAPITALAFCNSGPCEKVAALLSDGSITVWESLEADLWEETAEEMGTLGANGAELSAQGSLFELPEGEAVSSLTWLGEDALLVVRGAAPNHSTMETAAAFDVLQELRCGSAGEPVAVGGSVLTAVGDPSAVGCAAVLIQLQDGSVMRYQAGAGLVQLPPTQWLSSPCPRVCATPGSALRDSDGGVPPLVGITARGQLLWGQQLIANDITSFVVRSGGAGGAYLLYTTRENVMYTLPFSELLSWVVALPPAELANGGAQFPRNRGVGAGKQDNHYTAMHAAMRPTAAHAAANDVVSRAVEQGAYLVASPPHDVRVIMQMPRGNLETVAPRALVLSAIASSLQAGDYASAWDLAAPHRVDLNVLVDYGWPSFLANASAVVKALPHDSVLGDLLAALRPHSITTAGALYASMPAYKPSQASAERGPSVPVDDKVAAVCSALRQAMEAVGQRHFLGAILMSYAKQGDLTGALSLIKQLKEVRLISSTHQHPLQHASPTSQSASQPTDGTADCNSEQSPVEEEPMRHDGGADRALEKQWTAEDGMRYLLLYTEVEKIYKAALGLHDLALAYMVIAHSQRDPGEYMLELQGFASAASPALQKYAIDMHLGRWLPALQHLLSAGDQHFDAALQVAQDKGLLRELLALCREPSQRHNTVLRALAATLSGRSMHEDAGMALVAAGELPSAMTAYRAGGQWRMVLVLAGRLEYSKAAVQQLAEEMMEELSGMGQCADAAVLASEYLSDADNAVALLSQARQWREALRIAYRDMRDDLVDTVIAPAGAEAAAGLLADARENTERVSKYLQRYKEVQERRSNMEAALAGAEEEASPELERDFDEASEAGTAVSGMSAYTTASTTAGSTITSSGHSVSTIGGRKPQRKARQKASKGARIRQGSPQEEAALAVHITALAPSAQVLAEAGQLAELLVLLDHADDARLLQAAISGLAATQAKASDYVGNHPAAIDSASVRLLEASHRKAQPTATATWKWDILRPVQLNESEASQ